ncbi:MAG: DUF1566 domain-containing protein [Labilithrix sp.]|nr:DUF1566 domain-containing protein [Labilithrix sp.]
MARSRSRRFVFAALALPLPLMLACNGIIGLGDYTKGECAGARCTDGGLPDVVEGDADAGDAGPDVKGADPVSWAKWEMPNYGEGGSPPRPLNQVASGNAADDTDIVTDQVTGLVWRQRVIRGVTDAQDADAECRKVRSGAWRAPKRIELVTLLDYAKTSPPYLDDSKFNVVANESLWTTSEVRPFEPNGPASAQKYWAVKLETGAVEAVPRIFLASVLCVRAK